ELVGVDRVGRGAHLLPVQRRTVTGPGLGSAAAGGEQERRSEPAGRSGHGPHLSMKWTVVVGFRAWSTPGRGECSGPCAAARSGRPGGAPGAGVANDVA